MKKEEIEVKVDNKHKQLKQIKELSFENQINFQFSQESANEASQELKSDNSDQNFEIEIAHSRIQQELTQFRDLSFKNNIFLISTSKNQLDQINEQNTRNQSGKTSIINSIKEEEYKIIEENSVSSQTCLSSRCPKKEQIFLEKNDSIKKKKNIQQKKKQKYQDLNEDRNLLRYILFYADDIVQQGIKAKSESRYQQILGNYEDYQRILRENEGMYFDINVRPSSPKKNLLTSLGMQPFGKDPFKDASDADISHRSEINENESKQLKQSLNIDSGVNFSGKDNKENFINQEQQSPTFHVADQQIINHDHRFIENVRLEHNRNLHFNDQYQIGPNLNKMGSQNIFKDDIQRNVSILYDSKIDIKSEEIKEDDSENSLSSENYQKKQMHEKNLDIMLLSSSQSKNNTPKMQKKNLNFSLNEKQNKQQQNDQNQLQFQNDASFNVKIANKKDNQNNKASILSGQSEILSESISQMQKISSFLNNNYDSPNIKDIKQIIRRREIEEIDRKVSTRKLIQIQNLDKKIQILSNNFISQNDSSLQVQSLDNYSRNSNNIQLKSSNNPQNEKIFENQIDETSQDENEISVKNEEIVRQDYYERHISFSKKEFLELQENQQDSIDVSEKQLSIKSIQDQKEDRYGFVNYIANGDSSIQINNQMFLLRDIDYVVDEPKSGLLKEKKGLFNQQDYNQKDKKQSQYKRINLTRYQFTNDATDDINSVESQSSSNNEDAQSEYEKLRIHIHKSIVTNKQSVADKKFGRQNQLRILNNGIAQNSIVDSIAAMSGMENINLRNNKERKNTDWNQEQSISNRMSSQANFKSYNNLLFNDIPQKQKSQFFNQNARQNSQQNLNIKQINQSSNIKNIDDKLSNPQDESKLKSLNLKDFKLTDENLAELRNITKNQKRIMKQKKKERNKELKLLKNFTYKSKEQLEEENIIKNQEKQLMKLKRLSEKLLGRKINENCFQQDPDENSNNGGKDSSKFDVTTINDGIIDPHLIKLYFQQNKDTSGLYQSFLKLQQSIDRSNKFSISSNAPLTPCNNKLLQNMQNFNVNKTDQSFTSIFKEVVDKPQRGASSSISNQRYKRFNFPQLIHMENQMNDKIRSEVYDKPNEILLNIDVNENQGNSDYIEEYQDKIKLISLKNKQTRCTSSQILIQQNYSHQFNDKINQLKQDNSQDHSQAKQKQSIHYASLVSEFNGNIKYNFNLKELNFGEKSKSDESQDFPNTISSQIKTYEQSERNAQLNSRTSTHNSQNQIEINQQSQNLHVVQQQFQEEIKRESQENKNDFNQMEVEDEIFSQQKQIIKQTVNLNSPSQSEVIIQRNQMNQSQNQEELKQENIHIIDQQENQGLILNSSLNFNNSYCESQPNIKLSHKKINTQIFNQNNQNINLQEESKEYTNQNRFNTIIKSKQLNKFDKQNEIKQPNPNVQILQQFLQQQVQTDKKQIRSHEIQQIEQIASQNLGRLTLEQNMKDQIKNARSQKSQLRNSSNHLYQMNSGNSSSKRGSEFSFKKNHNISPQNRKKIEKLELTLSKQEHDFFSFKNTETTPPGLVINSIDQEGLYTIKERDSVLFSLKNKINKEGSQYDKQSFQDSQVQIVHAYKSNETNESISKDSKFIQFNDVISSGKKSDKNKILSNLRRNLEEIHNNVYIVDQNISLNNYYPQTHISSNLNGQNDSLESYQKIDRNTQQSENKQLNQTPFWSQNDNKNIKKLIQIKQKELNKSTTKNEKVIQIKDQQSSIDDSIQTLSQEDRHIYNRELNSDFRQIQTLKSQSIQKIFITENNDLSQKDLSASSKNQFNVNKKKSLNESQLKIEKIQQQMQIQKQQEQNQDINIRQVKVKRKSNTNEQSFMNNSKDLKKAQSTKIDEIPKNDKKTDFSKISQRINRNSEISSQKMNRFELQTQKQTSVVNKNINDDLDQLQIILNRHHKKKECQKKKKIRRYDDISVRRGRNDSIMKNVDIQRATKSQNKQSRNENSKLIGEIFNNDVFSNYTGNANITKTNSFHIKIQATPSQKKLQSQPRKQNFTIKMKEQLLSNPSESSKLKENWMRNPLTVNRLTNQQQLADTQLEEEVDDQSIFHCSQSFVNMDDDNKIDLINTSITINSNRKKNALFSNHRIKFFNNQDQVSSIQNSSPKQNLRIRNQDSLSFQDNNLRNYKNEPQFTKKSLQDKNLKRFQKQCLKLGYTDFIRDKYLYGKMNSKNQKQSLSLQKSNLKLSDIDYQPSSSNNNQSQINSSIQYVEKSIIKSQNENEIYKIQNPLKAQLEGNLQQQQKYFVSKSIQTNFILQKGKKEKQYLSQPKKQIHIIKDFKNIKNIKQQQQNKNEQKLKIEKIFQKQSKNTSEQQTPIFFKNTQDWLREGSPNQTQQVKYVNMKPKMLDYNEIFQIPRHSNLSEVVHAQPYERDTENDHFYYYQQAQDMNLHNNFNQQVEYGDEDEYIQWMQEKEQQFFNRHYNVKSNATTYPFSLKLSPQAFSGQNNFQSNPQMYFYQY